MRTGAIYNVIFNRKKVKLDPEETALVQVEIILTNHSKKYIGTGVYLYQDQWDQRTRQVVNTNLSGRLNKRIGDFISELRRVELSIIDAGGQMTGADLDNYFKRTARHGSSFHSFMVSEIKKRTDIVVGTRSLHNHVASLLKDSGIILFSDLTFERIQSFDNSLRRSGMSQTTISKRHQVVKTYIHLAEKSGLLEYGKNPYLNFSVSRGKHKIRARLDDSEIGRLIGKEIVDLEADLSRDISVFQIYTGIAYKDLCILRWSVHIRRIEGGLWIEGLRKKSGEYYSIFLIPPAVALMEKYKGRNGDFLFPCPTGWTQNRRLKVVAGICEINKKLTTHVFRHTAATMWIRDGVDIYTVKDVLGHSKLETTEIYAKLEQASIKKEMQKIKGERS